MLVTARVTLVNFNTMNIIKQIRTLQAIHSTDKIQIKYVLYMINIKGLAYRSLYIPQWYKKHFSSGN